MTNNPHNTNSSSNHRSSGHSKPFHSRDSRDSRGPRSSGSNHSSSETHRSHSPSASGPRRFSDSSRPAHSSHSRPSHSSDSRPHHSNSSYSQGGRNYEGSSQREDGSERIPQGTFTPNAAPTHTVPKQANVVPTAQNEQGVTITFKDLKLREELQRAIALEGYVNPTPIQAKAIPALLEGKDLIGIAQTGTGKTAAFTLPILHRMVDKYPKVPKTLILAPTRELAAQIGDSFSTYGRFLKFKHTVIFGGVGQGPQVNAIQRGVDIIIATPGRLLDLMQQGRVNLNAIEFFVLDEADRMLDMGFIRDIQKIITRLPVKKQTLFFSATMSGEISGLAGKLLHNPVRVEVAPQSTTVERIEQKIYFVDQNQKEKLLLELLRHEHLKSVLVFTRTKHKANKVEDFLNDNKIRTEAIHGNKSQNHRMHALKNFKSGVARVLVATDIAARGIDIDNISHVINFELPNEPESYVHRIGRTGRAGAKGDAFSFCSADERSYLHSIERLIRMTIPVVEHQFHSDSAMNARGSAARPPPKGGYRGGGNRNGGGNRGSGGRSASGGFGGARKFGGESRGGSDRPRFRR